MFNATRTLNAAASAVSPWIDCRNSLSASVTIVVPSGPNGTFDLEGTDDVETVVAEGYHGNPAASTAPYDSLASLYDASGSLTVAAATTRIVQLAVPPAFVRVRYTRTSGSGTVKLHFTGR